MPDPTTEAAPPAVTELDHGLDVRTPSPALREASRAQGRALLRVGRALWPTPRSYPATPGNATAGSATPSNATGPRGWDGWRPHHPVALGLVTAAAGLGPVEAAAVNVHAALTGPASAALRLLGLDPYAVHALLARLTPVGDDVTSRAAAFATAPVCQLPATSAPLLDITAEVHATWEVRLFAS